MDGGSGDRGQVRAEHAPARELAVLLLVLICSGATAQAGTSDHTTSIRSLDWLAGCWLHDGRDTGSVELWLAPAGGSMLAVSRIVHDGRTVSREFLYIEETADGSLRLTAMPAGQSTTVFSLAVLEHRSVVFENPDHDFPQRISYRLVDTHRLLARAEADRDGQNTGIDFPMVRGDCSAGD